MPPRSNLLPLIVCSDGTKVKLKLRFCKAVCLADHRFVCGIQTFHYAAEVSLFCFEAVGWRDIKLVAAFCMRLSFYVNLDKDCAALVN
ncbi:MAG: hypothetical protein ACKESB_01250 [Candidatus Hodgkinia cicadicola]